MTIRNNSVLKQSDNEVEKQPYVIMSAYRTLEVLKAFAQAPHRFGLSELTKQLGIEKNQLYRSLKTLEEAGFLVSDAQGQFSLGSIISDLNTAVVLPSKKSLVEVAQPYLDELVEKTAETVNLFIRAGDLAVCIDRRNSPQPVKLTSALGLSVALHAGAVPKAMLAQLAKKEQNAVIKNLKNLPQYTQKTILNAKKLRQELELIKERGYSISNEDFDDSARGVGAAILDASNDVIAGISVGGPSFRVNDEKLEVFGQLIVQVAQTLSEAMGYLGKSKEEKV